MVVQSYICSRLPVIKMSFKLLRRIANGTKEKDQPKVEWRNNVHSFHWSVTMFSTYKSCKGVPVARKDNKISRLLKTRIGLKKGNTKKHRKSQKIKYLKENLILKVAVTNSSIVSLKVASISAILWHFWCVRDFQLGPKCTFLQKASFHLQISGEHFNVQTERCTELFSEDIEYCLELRQKKVTQSPHYECDCILLLTGV